MIRKRHKPIQPETYVVVDKNGRAFIGLKSGYPEYSDDWSEAKPLFMENTKMLLREHGTELIKESEL